MSVSSQTIHKASTEQDRRVTDRRIAKTGVANVVRRAEAVLPIHKIGKTAGCRRIAAKENSCRAHVHIRCCSKVGLLQGKALRMTVIVRIHPRNKDPLRKIQAMIESRNDAAMR